MKLATTATEHAGGWEVEADDIDIIGCGPTREDAERDLDDTIERMWREYSRTPIDDLTDDAIELFVRMRRAGVGR